MNLSLTLAAKDQTQGAIGSAISGLGKVLSFAKSATVGLAGINLGLRPLISGLDSVIERGTRLNAVKASLSGLTGVTPAQASTLGRSLQAASHDVLGLSESLAILNKGLAAGLDMSSLEKLADFGASKALSIGEEPAAMIHNLVEAISTGKVKILDDLGLLREGVEGVEKSFDSIHGKGAFGGLSQTARVAQIATAVMRDMSAQQRRLGIGANESYFAWQKIKTAIGDSVDQLAGAVTGSEKFKLALLDARNFIAGISEHFEKGGSLGELFLGKGKSGGLLGIAGAALKDLFINAGLLIGAGIIKALAAALPLIERFMDGIAKKFPILSSLAGGAKSAISSAAGSVGQAVGENTGAAGTIAGVAALAMLGKRMLGRGGASAAGEAGASAAAKALTPTENLNLIQKETDAITRGLERSELEAAGATASRSGWRAAIGGAGSILSRGLAIATAVDLGSLGILALQKEVISQHESTENAEAVEVAQAIRRQALIRRRHEAFEARRRQPASPAGVGFMPGLGIIPIGPMMGLASMSGSMSDQLNAMANGLLNQVGWGGTASAAGSFGAEFAPSTPKQLSADAAAAVAEQALAAAAEGKYRLNDHAAQRKADDWSRMGAEIDNFMMGSSTAGLKAKRAAAAIAKARAAELVKQGYRLTDEDRSRLFGDAHTNLIKDRVAQMEAQRLGLGKELDVEGWLRGGRNNGYADESRRTDRSLIEDGGAGLAEMRSFIKREMESNDGLKAEIKKLVATLGSTERDIARAAG